MFTYLKLKTLTLCIKTRKNSDFPFILKLKILFMPEHSHIEAKIL